MLSDHFHPSDEIVPIFSSFQGLNLSLMPYSLMFYSVFIILGAFLARQGL
jgi:hypothetical protein